MCLLGTTICWNDVSILAPEMFVPPGCFPLSLAAQPTPAHIIPWQGTIYKDVEETGGEVRKHRNKRSHPSPLPPVYLPSPTSLRTYYVPGMGSIFSAFI